MTTPLLLNVASWLLRSRANGPGTRMVLWLQGCPFRCSGCQNPDYLEFRPHRIVTVDRVWEVFEQLPLAGISFSGGEPFAQAVALADLACRVQEAGKTVVCWSGYSLEQLQTGKIPGSTALLKHIDLLIDGLFIQEQTDDLVLRGSRNQKLHFLSGRITASDLVDIPRQEWVMNQQTVTYTGFPI
ncbi:4Fe-4S single cluster domain-containing protein [Iningainema tapete]|uniref:Anaerobic ribonucleoside-triphosphate reductase-activating protein n=1 Tax=Iningainema tapete BLCC-T55 TaxID=2748662 RepID=A0A8J6XG62_9CYAN|nr:4Fe-4S single cluster domain-containing protein [Iningainema tapete]MBD2775239.1 radical SAM protein [Iningainema tapete BLCC-T55]